MIESIGAAFVQMKLIVFSYFRFVSSKMHQIFLKKTDFSVKFLHKIVFPLNKNEPILDFLRFDKTILYLQKIKYIHKITS